MRRLTIHEGRAIRIHFHQKLLSYLQPVSLKQSTSEVSGLLELRLYHNRFQLLTEGACYSDGDHYFPALAVVAHLREFLQTAKRVLVLGAGLGSIVHVMRARGLEPRFTLVEKDKTVLKWARESFGETDAPQLDHVCGDAESFMAQNRRKYDLVFVDVFRARTVPDFVTEPPFLMQCRDALSPGGHVALNYIEVDQNQWQAARSRVAAVFPGCHYIGRDDSRILISPPCATAGTIAEPPSDGTS